MSPREPHPAGCLCVTCLRDERPSLAALDAMVAPAAPIPIRRSEAPTVAPPPSARCAGCRRVLLLGPAGEAVPCEYCAPREGDPVAHALALGDRMSALGEAFAAARHDFDEVVRTLTPDENLELLRRQVARLLQKEVARG